METKTQVHAACMLEDVLWNIARYSDGSEWENIIYRTMVWQALTYEVQSWQYRDAKERDWG